MPDGAIAANYAENIFVQPDRRADGGRRQVRVTRDGVRISRRFGGVVMTIAVPLSAYRGVALDVEAAVDGGASYRLSLAHNDPDLDVVLTETQDGSAVAADWKYWANYLELPRLGAENGRLRALDAPAAPAGAPRRRGAAGVIKRRPRFLARRQGGDAARLAAVFAGEREIICYE